VGCALTYYVNSKKVLELACGYIGNYKLKQLSPSIIQNFYNKLDKLELTKTKITANGNLRRVMDERGIGYMKLRYDHGINSSSLAVALQGKPIFRVTAEAIAEKLNVPIKDIFDITETKELYAYESIHKIKRTVRAVLAYAKKQRLITENYAKSEYLIIPPRPEHEIEYLDDELAKQFYNVLIKHGDIRNRTAILIILMTGMRLGELCGLEWGDVDYERKTVSIQRSLVSVQGHSVIEKLPKTKKSKRTISVPNTVLEHLKKYRVWLENYKAGLGDRWVETDKIFTGQFGGRVNPSVVGTWLQRILKEADLPHVTVHSLRHTNITLQIMAGVPLAIVAGRAGHARTSTTTDIYTHFIKSADKEAANTIENLFNNYS
jgi:integrase